MEKKFMELSALPQGVFKTQNYLCVDVKTRTSEIMRAGEMREGALCMLDEEHFEFNEQTTPAYTRNPIVWSGDYINVHLNKENRLMVHFKRLALFSGEDSWDLAVHIHYELQSAMEALIKQL